MARTDPVLEMLAATDLFQELARADLKRIYETGKEVDFRVGEELAVQGRDGGRFFMIVEGHVDISVNGRRRRKCGPGDYLASIHRSAS